MQKAVLPDQELLRFALPALGISLLARGPPPPPPWPPQQNRPQHPRNLTSYYIGNLQNSTVAFVRPALKFPDQLIVRVCFWEEGGEGGHLHLASGG